MPRTGSVQSQQPATTKCDVYEIPKPRFMSSLSKVAEGILQRTVAEQRITVVFGCHYRYGGTRFGRMMVSRLRSLGEAP